MKFKVLFFVLIVGLIFTNTFSAATFTWTGASGVDNNWNTPGNWDVGVGFPEASDDVIINSGTPEVNVNSTANDVTINGGTLSINSFITLDIGGNFLMTAGILAFQNSIFNCAGSWNDVLGTISVSGQSIVVLDGAGTISKNPLASNDFIFLDISGNYTAATNIKIIGSFDITTTGVLDIGAFTIECTGADVTIANGGL